MMLRGPPAYMAPTQSLLPHRAFLARLPSFSVCNGCHKAAQHCSRSVAQARRLIQTGSTGAEQGQSDLPRVSVTTPDPVATTSSAAAEPVAAAAPASAGEPEPTASTSGLDSLTVLTSTEPIDRLRYQAILIFDYFDQSKAGRLSSSQLQAFFTWCSRKISWSPGLSEVLQQVQASFAPLEVTGCSREEFIRIIRAQVHAVSTSPAYQGSMMRPDEAARLQAQMSLTRQELAAARWMFGLLDFDGDGKVSLAMYSSAQGVEAYVYDDKVEDADADDDGFIVFEEFLVSYAKPKPIGKNFVIMVINTLVIYLILQAPVIDVMIKVVLVGALMLRPQIISKPAAVLYDSIKAVIDQGRAQAELAKANRGVWRPA